MNEQAPISDWHLRSAIRRLPRFAKLLGSVGAIIAVAGALVTVTNYAFGWFQNPSEHYRAELTRIAQQPIIDASYSLLAKPGVTESLRSIPDVPQRRASMEALFTKYIDENRLDGILEQTVKVFDRIIGCQKSWLCHMDDYEALEDQMINVWFSYAGKIRQMRGAVTGSDFGVLLEQEAQRLRVKQKAKVG